MKLLINKTSSDIAVADTGLTVPADGQLLVLPQDYPLWIASQDVRPMIIDGRLVVSDGEDELSPRVGIGLIREIQTILTEYYTLTQDDDVLIGNGQILQLHSDEWELETETEQDDIEG